MQSLRGKVALITGASSGIGAAIAEYFANQGARLSLAGRKPDNLHDAASKTKLSKSDVLTTVGDIVKEGDRIELVAQTVNKFGQLDILVNNAGILYLDYLEDLPEDHYDSIMNINLKAPVLLTKLAIPHLVKSKGNIVNISSNASSLLGKEYGVYAMSKIALDAFTKVLAAELGPRGVRVNSLNAGVTLSTNIFRRSNMEDVKEVVENYALGSSLRRAGTPEEIAKVAAFLASDLASMEPQTSFKIIDEKALPDVNMSETSIDLQMTAPKIIDEKALPDVNMSETSMSPKVVSAETTCPVDVVSHTSFETPIATQKKKICLKKRA